MLTLAFNRSRRTFTERDRQVMNLMRPHLVQAYRNAEAMTEMAGQRAVLGEAVEASGVGVIALAHDRRVESSSPAARALLGAYFPTWRRPSRLPEAVERWVAQRQAEWAGGEPLPPREPLVIEGARGRLVVRLTAGRRSGQSQSQSGSQSLLLLQEQAAPAHGEPGRQPDADLPPRLRRVFQCLLEGDAEKHVATRLGLSRHTVHQYVKLLYKRLGVGSRAELMAKWVGRGRA